MVNTVNSDDYVIEMFVKGHMFTEDYRDMEFTSEHLYSAHGNLHYRPHDNYIICKTRHDRGIDEIFVDYAACPPSPQLMNIFNQVLAYAHEHDYKVWTSV